MASISYEEAEKLVKGMYDDYQKALAELEPLELKFKDLDQRQLAILRKLHELQYGDKEIDAEANESHANELHANESQIEVLNEEYKELRQQSIEMYYDLLEKRGKALTTLQRYSQNNTNLLVSFINKLKADLQQQMAANQTSAQRAPASKHKQSVASSSSGKHKVVKSKKENN